MGEWRVPASKRRRVVLFSPWGDDLTRPMGPLGESTDSLPGSGRSTYRQRQRHFARVRHYQSGCSHPTLDPHNVRRAFRRVLKHAALPPHFIPHCLRHTFASLLIASGKPIVYVQRQLGQHALITLTVDTYGKWLPMADKNAVDSLDDTVPNRVVAAGDGGRARFDRRSILSAFPRFPCGVTAAGTRCVPSESGDW